MRQLLRNIIHHTYRPWLQRHLQKERSFSYRGINVLVKPGVFHPGYFFSTKMLLDFLFTNIDVSGKTFLELGCGSGLIAIAAAKKGATVTATDISALAVENASQNIRVNGVEVLVLQSDLFAGISPQQFDVVVINPPYFKKDPVKIEDYAWYCGRNLEFFARLFRQLKVYSSSKSLAFMVLSDECDVEGIMSLAAENDFSLKLVQKRRRGLECNFIYRVVPT